ncbi:MAG: DEAD/DEAH box helicase [Pseudomonadota bacterium]
MADTPAQKARLDALGPGFVGRGQALADAGAVSNIEQGAVADAWVLTACVADGDDQEYRVYVRVDTLQVDGDCSCPRKTQCEHVAAAVLAARAAQGKPQTRPSAANLQGRVQRSADQRMVYLLRLSDDGHELSVCPSRQIISADGQASATPYSLTRLADSRQPDYVGEDDIRILHELADRMAGALDLVWAPLGTRCHALLEAIIATGRCLWHEVDGATLQLGAPLDTRLNWQVLRSGYQELTLEGEDQEAMRQLPLLPPWRVNPESGLCRPLATGHDSDRVAELLEAGPVSPEAVAELIETLKREAPDFPRPAAMNCRQLDRQAAEPLLQLSMIELGSAQRFSHEPAARLSFRYGSVVLDWDDEYSSALVEPGEALRVKRDRAAEELAVTLLEAAGFTPLQALPGRDYRPGEGGLWVARSARNGVRPWIDLQARRRDLEAEGWTLQGSAEFSPLLVEPDAWYGDLVAAAGNADVIELDLGVVIGEERVSLLPALLEWIERTPAALVQAIVAGAEGSERHITLGLDDHRVVRMGKERLASTLRALVDALDQSPEVKRSRLQLPRSRLSELAAAGKHWHLGGDEDLAELIQRLSAFKGVKPMEAPKGLQAELRPYQAYGLGWLQFLREYGFGGVLADDMGLGKTIQTLAHIQAEKNAGRLTKPALVVAPTSLLFNWRGEARRFAPELKVLTLHGSDRKGQFQWIDESDLVLTTYPLLSRDGALLAEHDFHLLILDEAQAIKNSRTRAAKEVRRLRAHHRLCLSGTPLENHLGELWSLFDFLMPGMLGSQSRFRQQVQRPIEREDDTERRDALARRIRPFFLRRTKVEVAPELPPKTEMIRAVTLEGDQLKLYERYRVAMHDKVRRALAGPGLDKSRILVLDALLKLRQICCDPSLIKDGSLTQGLPSAKRDLLGELLPELVEEGRRILVFSQFVSMLELIESDLERLGIRYVKLTGQTRDRQAVVERFQSGQVPVFLISLKAGGVGLNLTAADTVIHYDPWWNPAVEDQATDRAHRIGQDQNVFVYRLLTEQTVEQKVFELQQSKRGLIEGLFGGGGAIDLSADDLDALFEPLS